MPVYYEWSSKRKKGRSSKTKYILPTYEVTSHPLKVFSNINPSKSYLDTINKLSAAFDGIDPLFRFEQMSSEEYVNPIENCDDSKNYTKMWLIKRANILNKYTTGEKLTIISSFLPGGEKTLIRQVSNLNEKVKHRLEQLDDFDESSVRKTMGLSQQEYVAKINMLSDEIKKAWESEQRVKSFKIAIQCSKLLADVSVMQFYPSKFVLITEILDTFGNLVYSRLKEKSFGSEQKTVFNIDPNMVPESAKETCQNWMFKMASIRELLPRLYMEMALLKCYVFISKDEIEPAIARLTLMIRGIGNPLVATYLRVHLCRISANLLEGGVEKHFHDNFKEFLEEYQQIFDPAMKKKYEGQLLTLDRYLDLYLPAVQDWLLYGTLNSNKCKLTMLDQFLKQCEDIKNNELLLCCIVSAFDSSSIFNRTSKILEIIQNTADKMVMVPEILISLGDHLCVSGNGYHLAIETWIQTWWKIATNIKSTAQFLQVLAPWLQFSCSHLSSQHINIILRGTIRYMLKCGQPADEFSGLIQLVIKRMLKYIPDVEELFLMDAFMPMVELVQTTNARTMMAKTVLTIFISRYNSLYVDDHVIISCLMRLCSIIHESITAVTVEDECKVCAELIIKFIQLVTYHDDLERQLNFYVDCRAAFIKLDAVLVAVIYGVCGVCVRAGRGGGGGGAGAGAAWVARACAANCAVTAPALRAPLARAHAHLLAGQVALLAGCISQAEGNFKAFVGLIPDFPEYILEDGQKKPTHIKVQGMICDFLSTLLMLPDNVDSHCMAYVLSGFIKTMEKIHWRKRDPLYYMTLLYTLDLLCEMTQEKYSYGIESVLSNDELYGSEANFINTLEKYSSNICQELLQVLKELGELKETKKQHELCLELLWRVTRRGDLAAPGLASLAANLWFLSQKIQHTNNRLAKAILLSLEQADDPASQMLLKTIRANE